MYARSLFEQLILIFLSIYSTSGEHGLLVDIITPLVSVPDRFLDNLVTNGSQECSKEVLAVLKSAEKSEAWGLSVLDAIGRPDSGFLSGGLTFPGSYDQCLRQSYDPGTGDVMRAQFCFANLRFGLMENSSNIPLGLRQTLENATVRMGICFPTKCQPHDSEAALSAALGSSFVGAETSGDLGECTSELNNRLPASAGVIVVLCVLGFLVFLTVVATVYEVATSAAGGLRRNVALTEANSSACNPSTEQLCNNGVTAQSKGVRLRQALLSFSALRNGAKILHLTSSTSQVAGNVDVFHGMRFFSMTWIITGHSFSFALAWMAFRNPGSMSVAPNNLLSQTFANGTLAVDTFFYLSGFLVVYVTMRHLRKNPEKFSVPFMLLHRYIRLTPLMMLVIAFCAVLLPWTGRGPFWSFAIQMYGPWCRNNWWINALYLQNFINRETMCLSHSWYSAVDMQFFVVAVLVLAIIKRHAIVGLCSITLLFLVTVTVTVYLTVAHHLPGTSYIGIVPQDTMNAFMGEVYIKPYCRMGPYLVGMAAGYWMQSSRSSTPIRKRYIVLGWSAATILNLVVLYSTWPAYMGHMPDAAGAATYSALSRSAWALGLAWITYACATSNGGFVNIILSWKPLVPFSRLTYCAYLIHPVVMAAFYGSRESAFDFSVYFMLYLIMGNLFITYMAAFVLSTVFESPFIALEKIIFGS